MKHVRPISVAKASDAFGAIFFQIWLSLFVSLLTGAFGSAKGR